MGLKKDGSSGDAFAFRNLRSGVYTTNRTWRRVALVVLVLLALVLALLIGLLVWYWTRAERGGHHQASSDDQLTKTGSIVSNPSPYDGCFPSSAIVITRDGGPTRIDQVRLGQAVLDHGGDRQWTRVYAFAFLDDHDRVMTKISTTGDHDQQQVITLTGNHLLFRIMSGKTVVEEARAEDIRPGDRLAAVVNGTRRRGITAEVTNVQSVVGRGAHSPLTESGTLFVDGVWVSCYAGRWLDGRLDARTIHRYVMAPLRAIAALLGGPDDDGGVIGRALFVPQKYHLWYIRMLKSIHSMAMP